MKKSTNACYLAVVCLMLLVSNIAPVQAQKGWQVGLRVTPAMTWMLGYGGDTDSAAIYASDQTYGVNGGVAVGYAFNRYIAVFGQALYSTEGQNYTSYYIKPDADTVNILTELRTRFVKVPLLFKISTNSERKFSLAFELGPQFGFLTSIDERNNDTRDTHLPFERPASILADEVITNYPSRRNTFNTFSMSAVAGLGVDIKLRYNLKMNLQARFDYAFGDIENKEAVFNRTKDGITSTEDYYFSPRNRPFFNPDRGDIQNMSLGLTFGFTYIFIPKLHF